MLGILGRHFSDNLRRVNRREARDEGGKGAMKGGQNIPDYTGHSL